MKIEFKDRLSGAGLSRAFATLLLLLAACFAAHAQTAQGFVVGPSPTPVATPAPTPLPTPSCVRTIKADVVALDQVLTFNRLGAMNPGGMIFALRNDVRAIDPTAGLIAGNVQLKEYKRPRPLVLRMNIGDCLQILFQNLLASPRKDEGHAQP